MSDRFDRAIERGGIYELDGDDVRVLGISKNIVEIAPDGEVLETEVVVSYRVAAAGEVFATESDSSTVTLEWFVEAINDE